MNFDKFKGIANERDVVIREKSSLEIMLDFCDDLIKKQRRNSFDATIINRIYQKVYAQAKKEIPVFTEDDLKCLIFARANNEYGRNDVESQTLGLYTGVLLQLLTERNRKRKKNTKFHFNGRKSRFDYLFYFAKDVDELFVTNFTGSSICERIACCDGKANKIIVNNIKGFHTACQVGCYGGKAGLLFAHDCVGEYVAAFAGCFGGNVDSVVVAHCRGVCLAGESGLKEHGANLSKLVLRNNYDEGRIEADHIIRGKEAIKEYKRLCKEYSLEMLK